MKFLKSPLTEAAMAKILFAYEFGAGLGHLNILSAIARPLSQQHRLSFAVPDLPTANTYLSRFLGGKIAVHQAPKWSPVESRIAEAGTYCHTLAETLYLFDFDDEVRLQQACEIWLSLIEAERPDIMVVDSAPTARLALESRIPMVVVGTGYTVLPAGRVLPSMRPWQKEVTPRSRTVEALIWTSINKCRSALNGKPVDYLADLFYGDLTFISTLPEFDPYAAFRGSDLYVPFAVPDIEPGPLLDRRRGVPIFVYLPSVHPAIMPVIDALNDLDHECRLYVSDADPIKIAGLRRRNVRVHAIPADFKSVLPECKVIIHHAGLGTTLSAMAAGTAQLTLAAMLENQITAEGLKRCGVSHNMRVSLDMVKFDIVENIRSLLSDVVVQSASYHTAQKMSDIRRSSPLGRVIKSINGIIEVK